jgi:hypothetical protein
MFLVLQASLQFDGFRADKAEGPAESPFVITRHDLSVTSSFPRLALTCDDPAEPAARIDFVSMFSRLLVHVESQQKRDAVSTDGDQ